MAKIPKNIKHKVATNNKVEKIKSKFRKTIEKFLEIHYKKLKSFAKRGFEKEKLRVLQDLTRKIKKIQRRKNNKNQSKPLLPS